MLDWILKVRLVNIIKKFYHCYVTNIANIQLHSKRKILLLTPYGSVIY